MRRTIAGALLALPLTITLAAAGCGKPAATDGVATAGGGADPAVSAGAASMTDEERQLKFTQCMRDNGVDLPDPEPGSEGKVRIAVGPDVDPQKVQAAMETCRSYLPNGGKRGKLDPEQVEKMRELATCMRENGVPEFPDPDPDGGINIVAEGGIKRDNAAFKAALEKCQQFAPKIRVGGGK